MKYTIDYYPGRILISLGRNTSRRVRDHLRLMGVRYLSGAHVWVATKDFDKIADYLKEAAEKESLTKQRISESIPRKGTQLCERCGKAAGTFGWCNWSRYFMPVDGWEATPTKIRVNGGGGRVTESYHITKCPEFVEG